MERTTVICDICESEDDVVGRKIISRREDKNPKMYIIDLCKPHRVELETALEPFVSNARYLSDVATVPSRSQEQRRRDARVRHWAKAQGLMDTAAGRLPAGIRAQYDAAHPDDVLT